MQQSLINNKKTTISCLRSTLFVLSLLLFTISTVFAQVDKKITIPYKEATGLQLTELIQKETGYTFSFDEPVAGRLKRKIEIPGSPAPATVDEILLLLHRSMQINWKQIGSSIVLSLAPEPVKKQPPPPGSLKGRVVDFETSQPLQGATVKLEETGATTLSDEIADSARPLGKILTTDEKGYYSFKDLPEGRYTLRVSFAGYQTNSLSNIRLTGGRTTQFDVKMQAGGSLNEVVVSSAGRRVKAVTHTTDREIIREIRNSNSIVTGISSEQISKSADRNAAQVVQRTSGITLKDEKFVISRGMDPRYTAIFLNGNLAPSTELYSRTFALDLIPSRIIDRILVYKSPAPDIYGDMSGGAIKIFTKDAKTVRHFDIELVASDRVGASFEPILTYKGGKYDYLGFDDGARKLPSGVPGFGDLHKSTLTQPQYVQAFSPVLQYGYRTALPDLQLILNYYTTFTLGRRRISSLSSLNYRYEAQRNDIYTQTDNTNAWSKDYGKRNGSMGNEDQNIENVQINLLQNFSMRLRDSGQVYFRNFVLEDATNAVIVRLTHANIIPGQNGSPTGHGYTDVMGKNNILSFTQRFLYSGNLGGEHRLGHKKQSIRWNLGYTYSHQDIPDQRIIRLQHTPYYTSSYSYPYTMPAGTYKTAEGVGLGWESYYRGQDNVLDPQPVFGMITRLWLRNTEGVYNASADYDFHCRPWITLKAGALQQWKEREVYRKQFKVNDGQEGGDPRGETHQAGYYSYSDWKKVIFSEQDLRKLWSNDYLRDDATALKVYDNTQTQDSYKATEQLNAGYLAFNAQLLAGRLDIYGGLRTEYDRQKLAAAPGDATMTTPILVDRPLWSWLPSLNLNYRSRDNWVLRAAYGRTVNRPEFREISPFYNFDFLSNESIFGNPKLISAHLDNYDLRAEFYPTGTRQDEMISLGGFYKKLYDPIERIREQAALEQAWTTISYKNAGQGDLYGMEMELHKNLGFIGGKFFRNLSIIANGTLIHSEVNIPDTIRLGVYDRNGYKRPLQGQAPYIANAGLFYDNAGSGTKFSISYNITGTRIYAAGRYMPYAQGGGFDSSNSVYRGSILELPRHLVDLSITQRIIRSLQLKLSMQNLLNEAISFAEDNNFNYKYDKERGVPQYNADGTPRRNPDGTQSMKYEGDNIFRKYYPNRYIRLTLTYAF